MPSHTVPTYHLQNKKSARKLRPPKQCGGGRGEGAYPLGTFFTCLLYQVYAQLIKEWQFGKRDEVKQLSYGGSHFRESSVAIKG